MAEPACDPLNMSHARTLAVSWKELKMSGEGTKSRTVLPIPSPPQSGFITYDAKDPESRFPKIEQLRPPRGAPNVLLILIDDAGFGSSSAFGGPC